MRKGQPRAQRKKLVLDTEAEGQSKVLVYDAPGANGSSPDGGPRYRSGATCPGPSTHEVDGYIWRREAQYVGQMLEQLRLAAFGGDTHAMELWLARVAGQPPKRRAPNDVVKARMKKLETCADVQRAIVETIGGDVAIMRAEVDSRPLEPDETKAIASYASVVLKGTESEAASVAAMSDTELAQKLQETEGKTNG